MRKGRLPAPGTVIGHTREGTPVLAVAGGDGTLDTLLERRGEIQTGSQEILEAWESGEALTDEQRTQLRGFRDQLRDVNEEIAAAEGDAEAVEALRAARKDDETRREAHRAGQRPAMYGQGPARGQEDPVTLGEIFTASDAYRGWIERFPDGGPSEAVTAFSHRIKMEAFRAYLGMPTATERLRGILTPGRFRTLVTSADTAAGDLVRPDFLGLLEPGLVRPLTIRDLVTVIPTSSDAIEYVKEVSREANAATVAEATAATGTTGTKPEGGVVFDIVSTTIKTIAEWVPATRRILADATGLRAYIDQYLLDDVAIELEDQMVAGNGAGENFTGILNTSGIVDVGAPAGGQSVLDTIRTAKRQVMVQGRTRPTAIAVNPADSEKIDLLKVNAEVNHFAGSGPFQYQENQPIWGLRRVESEGIPAGTFLVGDFRRAVLFDREATTISVGTINDDFIRNIVRILAEMRAGFGVLRPKAFAKGSVP
jgi:HK97 family phage major capsid protein